MSRDASSLQSNYQRFTSQLSLLRGFFMLTFCHLFTNVTKSVSIVTPSELGTSNTNTTIYYTEQAEIKRTKQPYTTKGGVEARQVSCNWGQSLFVFRARTGFPVPVNFFTYRKKHSILPIGRTHISL